MKLKLTLATATALGLLMGGAMANNNQAQIKQNGADNQATIDQSKATNSDVGRPGVYHSSHNYGHIEQNGVENKLSITQEGNGHDVSNWGGDPMDNTRQIGNRNEITILQQNRTNAGSSVRGITQTGYGAVGVAPNTLNVKQTDNGSTASSYSSHGVRSVNQTNTVVSAGVGDTNSIDILQSGTGHNSGNSVRTTSQNGSANSQDIDQIGALNHINSITQDGPGNSLNVGQIGDSNLLVSVKQTNTGGSANTAVVSLEGSRNGSGSNLATWSPWTIRNVTSAPGFSSGSDAGRIAGVTQASISQDGTDNHLNYSALGNNNLYGFAQKGAGNEILADVNGSYNQLAIHQLGDDNDAYIDQHSSDNEAGIEQLGKNNYVNAQQTGTGNHNLYVSVSGNDNGRGEFSASPPLKGFATTQGLTNGSIFQRGSDNTVSLTISDSNSNKFAFLQTNGSGNSITATINAGSIGSNQILGVQNGSDHTAVVTQYNNSNIAVFHQLGSGNVTTIVQGNSGI